ncbi:MAG: hypothetical protein H6817_11050, partial [Phycisphaerales bacterium]|nr:hypothetical protein [Phycisphaerales bacterium]
MSYLLEIVGRGLLAELSAAFRDRLDDLTDVPTAGLSRLVKAHPEKASHHVRIGIRALSERKSVDARGHFEDALTREPDNVVALVGLACALDDCGQPAEAAGHLD